MSRPIKQMLNFNSIEVRSLSDKGLGVVATQAIPPYSILPYRGRLITEEELLNIEERDYVIHSGRRGLYLNANPKDALYDAAKWIASRVNEPSKGQYANMLLLHKKLPIGGTEKEMTPVFVTISLIEAGDELTVYYGDEYKRTYLVGRCPKRPHWLR